MSVKHNTEYMCDGCGKVHVEKVDRMPDGWTMIIFIGGTLHHRDRAHVCSKLCFATMSRKLADEYDPQHIERHASGGPMMKYSNDSNDSNDSTDSTDSTEERGCGSCINCCMDMDLDPYCAAVNKPWGRVLFRGKPAECGPENKLWEKDTRRNR